MSERANVTAGGCLRNPLSCYTLRPSIACSNKEHRALPRRTERASGVNILSTLFFHRTSRSRSLRPPVRPLESFRFSRSLFSVSPLRKGSRRCASFVRSFVRSLARSESIVAVVVGDDEENLEGRREPGEIEDRGKRGTEFCKAN